MAEGVDVLFCLCGLTPQVVTETLWALGRQTPPVHPSEIWILTTEAGRRACLTNLLGPKGALARYAREYRLRTKPRCGPDRILLLQTLDGAPLEDVRSARDNQAVADQIAEALRRQTERPGIRLHCSVAGGRKTMGILLAGALQLYGRAEDRLYHVLVWPPGFESNPEFFYPPRKPGQLKSKDGPSLNTQKARVELAEVPYIRLRPLLSPEVLSGRYRMTDLVEQAERELHALATPVSVNVKSSMRGIQVGDRFIRLQPALLRLYSAFARLKTRECVEPHRPICGECTACYVPYSSEKWDESRERLEALLNGKGTMPRELEEVRSKVSKVNHALEQGLGSRRLAGQYGLRTHGERNEKTIGLAVSKELIKEAAEQEEPLRVRA